MIGFFEKFCLLKASSTDLKVTRPLDQSLTQKLAKAFSCYWEISSCETFLAMKDAQVSQSTSPLLGSSADRFSGLPFDSGIM